MSELRGVVYITSVGYDTFKMCHDTDTDTFLEKYRDTDTWYIITKVSWCWYIFKVSWYLILFWKVSRYLILLLILFDFLSFHELHIEV